MTDPIADMLTRIRNALVARHDEVEIPKSKIKEQIAKILTEEGYVSGYKMDDKNIVITLKYGPKNQKVISGIKRISKPGLRVYAPTENMPVVLGGMGIAILSTNKGIMTNKQANNAPFAADDFVRTVSLFGDVTDMVTRDLLRHFAAVGAAIRFWLFVKKIFEHRVLLPKKFLPQSSGSKVRLPRRPPGQNLCA